MGFRSGALATVWDAPERVSDGIAKVRISTNRKNKQTNSYETDFSGFISFIGKNAVQAAMGLTPRSRIVIKECEVTTKYDKVKRKEYVNYMVYSFDMPNPNEYRQSQGGNSNYGGQQYGYQQQNQYGQNQMNQQGNQQNGVQFEDGDLDITSDNLPF